MARIMICDDSKTILNLLHRKLTEAGHEVVGMAKDGVEGVQIFKATNPDISMLDITMPNKDGRECLCEILKLKATAKVVMVSALQDSQVVQDCLKQGAKAFVSKEKLYKDEEFKRDILPILDGLLKAA